MSSAQVGKTELLLNTIGYHVHQDPAPMLLIQPTLEMAEAFSKDRLAPMVRDTPALKGRIADPKARDSGNTMLHKRFTGGHITMAGANSAASLASRPIRIVLCDEVDRYPASAGTEGDPVSLARKRSATFYNRKIVLTSTPTVKGLSRIESAFEESDQRRFWVRCPHCEERQYLKWSQVQWTDDNPLTAGYACEHCGALLSEADKPKLLASGQWIAGEASHGIAGFHINELYSPWRRWSEVVADFISAKRSAETLKTWINTSLGETWEEEGEKAEPDELYRRREHYPADVPDGVISLTAGIDVQDDRFEIEITGWGEGEESWGIDYIRLFGDLSKPDIWEKLASALKKPYSNEDGTIVNVRLACIDSGGHFTDEVYKFSRSRGRQWIIPIKGASIAGKPVANFPRKPNRKGVYLTEVGSDTAKELIFQRFKTFDPGAGYCHWPVSDAFDETYFRQLTNEKKVTKYRHGRRYFVWETTGRNEPLDCRVYSLVAIRILQQHMGISLEEKTPREMPKKTENIKPIPPQSGFFNRPRQSFFRRD